MQATDENASSTLTSKTAKLSGYKEVKDQNVSRDEMESIDKLKKDDSVMILPADKGQVTVVLNTKEYEEKCQQLLGEENTYKKLKGDPTRKFKGELVSVLKDLKDRKVITSELQKKLHPTIEQPLRFYSLPKVLNVNTPLHPIVSSIDTITYAGAQYLADVLSPLVGKTEHHVKNSKGFAEYVKKLKVDPDEELRSYDVSTLFTSVPVDKAMDVIRKKLEEDESLKWATEGEMVKEIEGLENRTERG